MSGSINGISAPKGRRRLWRCLILAGLAAVVAPLVRGEASEEGIIATKHNLSVSGQGPIRAASEPRVCIFCHTPHHASPLTPLWSRPETTTVYDLYSSTTRTAKPGQPTGSSRLCLSCHDGTIAVGALYGAPNVTENTIPMVGGFTRIPVGNLTNLGGATGKDLTNDHPISFEYTAALASSNGQLTPPSLLPPQIRLDKDNYLQCTSCHNPHTNPFGKFLVMDPSELCVKCHNITGWEFSGHATNGATAEAGCGNCHVPHNAQIPERLLKGTPEEKNCLPCHSDIETLISKLNAHHVGDYFGVHDENESPLTAQEHVECEDCHNPHQAKVSGATPPDVNGSLIGVTGVSLSNQVKTAEYEYEICFKCHAYNNFPGPVTIIRQISTYNGILDFALDNPSFHPVTAPGVGTDADVTSLRTGWSTDSRIYCSDCHGNDRSVNAGGGWKGPNGPHGSGVKYMLLRNYETETYPLAYSDNNYALCYRCHDQNLLFNATSPFKKPSANLYLHDFHVRTKGVPCSVCHDPHGVSRSKGATDKGNAHLINFDKNFATGSYDSIDGTDGTPKSCSVSCHSVNPRIYGPGT